MQSIRGIGSLPQNNNEFSNNQQNQNQNSNTNLSYFKLFFLFVEILFICVGFLKLCNVTNLCIWNCMACTYTNPITCDKCGICSTSRNGNSNDNGEEYSEIKNLLRQKEERKRKSVKEDPTKKKN